MFKHGVSLALIILVLLWLYQCFIPPPPNICGSNGGPPITGPRIALRDGRHLSYEEFGVPKDEAKYQIIFIHGHTNNKKDNFLATSALVEEFKVYMVSFDRPGYGESDPDPRRTIQSSSLDIEELADQLGLRSKFYVVAYSMGGMLGWGCLKYIPHRLSGITLINPAISFWWPGLPTDLVEQEFYKQDPYTQWNFWIAHNVPWLLYWWETQNTEALFPPPPNMTTYLDNFQASDSNQTLEEYSTQQGLYESYMRDILVGFGEWEFVPMDLKDPFVNGIGSVHLWQGGHDTTVPVPLQHFLVNNMSWLHYHEVENGGHKFPYEEGMNDQILKTIAMEGSLISSSAKDGTYIPISE
ncbi:hypothetical protein Leryth_020187 [Lithospermum erythrorhizon]|nr:hypothetical protein Leryth_020187 [Lithospermum erythrorhizon]